MLKPLISISFLLTSLLIVCTSLLGQGKQENGSIYSDSIPTLKIHFYLLSDKKIEDSKTAQILPNIEYLNQEFEGQVHFILDKITLSEKQAYLPDLHTDYFKREGHNISRLIDPIEEKGAINIYVMDTYLPEGKTAALLGFTPILKSRRNTYSINSPRFDRIYIAFPALADPSTIVHEMGHFLGLDHPWDMNHINLDLMGINEGNFKKNHMTYNLNVDHFTQEQLARMRDFAWQFRDYLMPTEQDQSTLDIE